MEGTKVSDQFWDCLQKSTKKVIRHQTLSGESGHSSMEILLGIVKLKTDAFLKLISSIKEKLQAAVPDVDMRSEHSSSLSPPREDRSQDPQPANQQQQ